MPTKLISLIQTFLLASRAARTVAALHDPLVGTRAFATVVLVSPVLSFIAFRVEMVDCLLIWTCKLYLGGLVDVF